MEPLRHKGAKFYNGKQMVLLCPLRLRAFAVKKETVSEQPAIKKSCHCKKQILLSPGIVEADSLVIMMESKKSWPQFCNYQSLF